MPELKIIRDTDQPPRRSALLAAAVAFGWLLLALFTSFVILILAGP